MLNRSGASQPQALPANSPRQGLFRVAALFLASVLGIYCLWMILAELYRPGLDRLPTDPQSAAIAVGQRRDANAAAWIGFIRGELWAQSAYTYADLLWNYAGNNGSDSTSGLDKAREKLDWTVRDAPHEAGAWLLLAGLALRYHWPSPGPAEALRMSYYTGPSELPLLPLRLRVAVAITRTRCRIGAIGASRPERADRAATEGCRAAGLSRGNAGREGIHRTGGRRH